MKFLTSDELELLAKELELRPNEAVFWAEEQTHENVDEVFREGKKPQLKSGKNIDREKESSYDFHPEMALTWNDIGKRPVEGADPDEPIPETHWKEYTIEFPNGLSLFLRPKVPDNQDFLGHEPFPPNIKASKKLEKAKKDSGYSPRFNKHYYRLMFTGKLPDLKLIYDGQRGSKNTPPGHCTLTVARQMTVHEYQALVTTHVVPNMSYIGPGLTGFKHK